MIRDDLRDSILRSRVNSLIGILFVGSVALAAGLIIWGATFGENPIADRLAAQIIEAGEI